VACVALKHGFETGCVSPEGLALPGRRLLDARSLAVRLCPLAAPITSARALPMLSLATDVIGGATHPEHDRHSSLRPAVHPASQLEQVAQDRVLLGFESL